LFLSAVLVASGQQRPETPVPHYQIKRAAAPILTDGLLNEPAWASAEKMELGFPWTAQTGPRQKTTVRLLWDDNFLYLSFESEDSDITATHTERDSAVDQDDSVQVLINPKPSQTHAYIVIDMNVRGVIHDYLSADGKYFFQQFNLQGVRVASYVNGTLNERGDTDRGWTLEAAIPWANFDDLSRQHGAGAIWSGNFGRWDGVAPDRTYSIWSDSLLPSPSPHAPLRFGELRFDQ
jgi:Carbohydrate family 9 binding domain-like